MSIQRIPIIVTVICILSNLNQCAAEESQNGCVCGCGFGFEVLLTKLEHIEEKLEALTKWQESIPEPQVHPKCTKESISLSKNEEIKAKEVSAPIDVTETATKVAVVGQTLKQSSEKKTNLPLGIVATPEQLAYGEDQIYSSCLEVPSKVTGKYLIRLSDDAEPVNLLCDMQSVDVGWIVVQHRFNGSERFYRDWNDYRDGFGSLDGEFWLGLDRISSILNNGGQWEIMFWMMNFQRQIRYAKFNNILLGNATDGYTLKQVGKYSGNAGDSISLHCGMKFTTFDRDNDPARYNCAKKHRGGWWYHKTCVSSNLNGEYKNAINDQANNWPTMGSAGLMQSKIMIRQIN